MAAKGDFFAIGKQQWSAVCGMSLNHAVCFLVLARGTGRDNATTRWSAEAVFKHTGMAWRRASHAIKELDGTDLISSATMKGKRPTRKLALPKDKDMEQMLWLPNALVTGAASEVPPIARIRQAQNLEHLQAFVELYGAHDLAGDGGLPRSLIRKPYDVREHICDLGQFVVYGFRSSDGMRYCYTKGALERFHGRKGTPNDAWAFLGALEKMGLLERVDYLAEGDSPDAELIHALTGDEAAEAAKDAAALLAEELPGGFRYEVENYDYALPVLKHLSGAAVVGVYRLTYRPHTRATAGWYARHIEACTAAESCYRALAQGDFQRAVAA